jgi:hypothetical protein
MTPARDPLRPSVARDSRGRTLVGRVSGALRVACHGRRRVRHHGAAATARRGLRRDGALILALEPGLRASAMTDDICCAFPLDGDEAAACE